MSLQGTLAVLDLVAVPAWSLAAPYDGAEAGGNGSTQVAATLLGQLIPVAAGMLLRARRPRLADQVANVLLITMVIYIFATTADQLADIPVPVFAAFALLARICLASYATPGLITASARRAVAMTSTVRNLSPTLLVAGLAGLAVVW